MSDLVLVTGASGFIAQHTCKTLCEKGYRVRGTVRSNDAKTADHLRAICPGIELVKADLLSDDGWATAVQGTKFVVHMASPFVFNVAEEEQLTKPAVEGTRRVLTAAAKAGVKRVVLTSSVVAVSSGRDDPPGYVHGPSDWSIPEKCDPYAKSKTLAEQTAWELVKNVLPAETGNTMEMATINPSLVVGPLLSAKDGTSASLCLDLFTGKTPVVPHLGFGTVDVRDVAEAHAAALTAPEAAGRRFILSAKSLWYDEMAKALSEKFKPQGFKVATFVPPYWLLWLASFFVKEARGALNWIGKQPAYDSSAAVKDLGITFRDPLAGFVDMGQSLVDLGLVEPKTKKGKTSSSSSRASNNVV